MSRFAPIKPTSKEETLKQSQDYKYGWADDTSTYTYKAPKGLNEQVVRDISKQKKEPKWMLEYRLQGLKHFLCKPMPSWGADLSGIDFDEIYYYLKPTDKVERKWEDVPDKIKQTFDKLGIPQAERKYLAGVKSQYDSEVVYGSLKKQLKKQGVIFLGMDEGLAQHPEIVKQYFGSIIPVGDNKFAALNTAVWSGGSFIYVPKGVEVELPLQAYFRINSAHAGQFERTLIIVEKGAKMHYVEGCSSPQYIDSSLHSAVVEIIVKKNSRVQYTTIQNWYHQVYNLVTKRAKVEEDGKMFWVDGNLGCLIGDSLVSTPNGYQQIEKLKKNDLVYAFDFNKLQPVQVKIKDQQCIGTKTTYQLLTDDYRKIQATDNHPFLKLEKRKGFPVFEPKWIQLKEIKPGDHIAIASALPDDGTPKQITFSYESPYLKNIPVLPKQTNEDIMWLFGAYIGDGCIEKDYLNKKKASRVNFAVPVGDKAHDKLVHVLKQLHLPWEQKKVTKRVSSIYFGEFILDMGFKGNAKTKKIPDWVFSLPLQQKLAFIEGYLDTDGHVRKVKKINGEQYGQLTFACVSKKLLKQMKMLMISCGLEPKKITKYLKERRLYKEKLKEYTTYYMSMNLRNNLDLIRNKNFSGNYFRFVKVRDIQKQSKKKVYDIEVPKYHNFIANGIIVHNSKTTMKYPACVLTGKRAHGEILSVAFAGKGQQLDAGGKVIHQAPDTTSQIISKSISKDGGQSSYRGMVHISKQATNSKSKVVCDALILDPESRSDTYPVNRIYTQDVQLEHEATVSKIGEEQLFYLMSRGLSEEQANAMIVSGFIEPIVKELPMEYAVELNRLVELEMEGSVG